MDYKKCKKFMKCLKNIEKINDPQKSSQALSDLTQDMRQNGFEFPLVYHRTIKSVRQLIEECATKTTSKKKNKIWAILIILTTLTTLVCNLGNIKEMFRGKPVKQMPKQKIEDIDIEQKGETLSNVTGVDISNNKSNIELGKVKINQEGNDLNNVTGMKMKFDANSGEVELKDKVEIKQKGPRGQSSVIFNADQPGVNITFNKKSEDVNN